MMVTLKKRGFLHWLDVGLEDPKAHSRSKALGTSSSILSQRPTCDSEAIGASLNKSDLGVYPSSQQMLKQQVWMLSGDSSAL